MKRLWILVVVIALVTLATFAKDKNDNFADAVLVKQVWVDNGLSCSSSGSGQVDDNGDIRTNTHGNCAQNRIAHYTVESGGIVYVLQPKLKHPKTAILTSAVTMGYSAMFAKMSVLHGVPLGTHVGMKIDKHGDAVVRVADGREAPYRVIEASPLPASASTQSGASPTTRPTQALCLETTTDPQGNMTCLKWATQQ